MNEQIEAIRNEIKRRMDKHWEGLPDADSPEDDWTHNELCELGAYKELEHLETFIDSLPEEPDNEETNRPKLSDSLEEAAEKYEEEHTYQRYDGGGLTPEYNATLTETFLAGAEWQKEQMMDEWLEDRGGCFFDGVEEGKAAMEKQMTGQVFAAYKLGLEDARAVLEEVAIEGEVVKDIYGQCHVKSEPIEGCFGAKVKIVIIKEDNQ